MRWGKIVAITVVIVCIVWFEWPKMKRHPKKDKIAFLILVVIGWGLGICDLSNMPGPTSWIISLFKPLSTWIE